MYNIVVIVLFIIIFSIENENFHLKKFFLYTIKINI